MLVQKKGSVPRLTRWVTLRHNHNAVKRRLLRIIVLLWIGWYAVGPAAETFDYWDGPHQELHDILFNAGGGVTLIACAFSFVILQTKKLRERCSPPHHSVRTRIVASIFEPFVFEPRLSLASIHSPPIPLRI